MKPNSNCKLCDLWKERTNLVLPSGDLESGIVFVGEAPGEAEDLSGKPFVGRSGKILDKMMQEEGLDRSRIMITNTVKCRPPSNRDPTQTEMNACRPFLEEELYNCRLIIGLGKAACRDLLNYEGKLSDIANTKISIKIKDKDITFIPTFHPAACIYSKDARVALKTTIKTVVDEYLL